MGKIDITRAHMIRRVALITTRLNCSRDGDFRILGSERVRRTLSLFLFLKFSRRKARASRGENSFPHYPFIGAARRIIREAADATLSGFKSALNAAAASRLAHCPTCSEGVSAVRARYLDVPGDISSSARGAPSPPPLPPSPPPPPPPPRAFVLSAATTNVRVYAHAHARTCVRISAIRSERV